MSEPTESITPTSSKTAAGAAKSAVVNVPKSPKTSRKLALMEEQSCDLCQNADNSRMVQCDYCKNWYHFECANVTEDIEFYDWICTKCETAETDHQKKKPSRKNARSAVKKINSSIAGAKKSKTVKPKKMVKNSTPKDHQQNQQVEREKSQNSADEKLAGNEKVNKSTKSKSVGSDSLSRSQALKMQLQKVHAEEKLMLEEMKRKRELLVRKFELMEEIANTDEAAGSNAHLESDSDSDEYSESEGEQSDDDTDSGDGQDEPFIPKRQSTPVKLQSRREKQHSRMNVTLSREQIAARQVVSCDLPRFGGNPDEWPMFISTYESTTTMCGYRDEENMIRLRNCLKDEAFTTVRSFLMHPSTVAKAISVLKLRFGQPHMIISTLREKILNMAPVRSDSMERLVDYALAVQNLRSTIDACGRKEYMRDVTLMQDLISKLPPAIKLDWARHSKTLKKSNLVAFSDWIYSIAEDASIVADPRKPHCYGQDTRGRRQGKAFINTHAESLGQQTAHDRTGNTNQFSEKFSAMTVKCCQICKGSCSSAAKCKRFLGLSYEARWAAVREFRICRRCLRQHGGNCNSKACGVDGCTFKHNSLLHKNLAVPSEAYASRSQTRSNEERSVNTHQMETALELFRYLPVTLFGPNKHVNCYAFLDDGSELTLLDEQIACDLELPGESKPLCLKWTGGTHRFEEKSKRVNIGISGLVGKRFELSGVRTVNALELPQQSLNIDELRKQYKHLKGVPVESYNLVRPRILIGLKHANVSLVRRCREGKEGEPIAAKTHLGWTIFGGCSSQDSSVDGKYTYHICTCNPQNDDRLHHEVKQYFGLDSLGITTPVSSLMSKDDERAISLLKSRTQIIGDKYETGLLWRFDNIHLPDSRSMALQRLNCLQRRLAKDAELNRAFNEKLADYQAKGYIRKVMPEELARKEGKTWYLPTFPVLNPNKPGKIRIVWDAAASVHGVCLNTVLLTGPDLMSSLISVLYQFREYRIAICGDIREMFLQIAIRPEDQFYQLFLWRDKADQDEASTFVVEVMIFGARSSPTTAQFVKNHNAQRFETQYPAAAAAIQNKHYVDDMLASTETEKEAIELAKAVKFIHAQGGFEIRNWTSNSPTVLQALSENPAEEKNLNFMAEMATEKILGMWWNTRTDCFMFKICYDRFDAALFNGRRAPTKRELLRILMTVFDPLGLISHFLMLLKVTLQEVWRIGLKWDEQITGKQLESWRTWIKLLPKLENIRIPRCYRRSLSIGDHTRFELHTFVDAGNDGMAAVAFLRVEEDGLVECALVSAKTRVAPLKYLSTPRSELQAAVIGARLANNISNSLSLNISQRYYWSDSRNVLCWLRSDHRRYSPYVAARVSEILETTEIDDWHWVKSEWNVADDGTKLKGQVELQIEDRWFQGPAFLKTPKESWPERNFLRETTDEEIRTNVLFHGMNMEPVVLASNYSRWKHLVEVTAYVQRFVNNVCAKKKGLPGQIGPPTSDELRLAQEYHFRQAQQEVYREELRVLQSTNNKGERINHVAKSSKILKLSPFLGPEGLLRMNSRAAKCKFLFPDEKYPIILPDDHPVTHLVLTDFHERYHHRNYATVANEVRRRFCIPRLKRTLLKMRCKCQWCRNRDVKPAPPEMAELPQARLAAFTSPFSHVGVDFFGPFEVIVGRKIEKRWGVLLTCLTVRALHIEVANSLSTSSCIMAVNNFIARRGHPICFYSDRGTNFIGASKELREAVRALDKNEMAKEFTTATTSWRFNPPAAPHMGGCWERLIQTVKRNLTEVLKCRRPTDEELRSTLTQIEAILNNRPLTEVPVDNESEPALTPNHFLLGSSDGSKPLIPCDDNVQAVRRGWQVSQVMANVFWKRWLRSYLPDITRRSKWFKKVNPIAVGDIVVITDPEHPRNCWPKGKVIGIVQKDGQVRRATIQTSKGVYERPAVKLAVLDIGSENV
ncbi:uncharacterized protein LOC128739725 [Sabethes cyaneus]|uniref:uncharacterized protein LOC128739725 n=1 Tax=Sabethes cyaneus TaxID=53552 RepID=UPI00237D7180|nr:uncharacterized protein LOC128739725 [Sabethes cyaneus]